MWMTIKKQHYSLKGFPVTGENYRRFSSYWWKEKLNPDNYYRAIKYFCQRGWRGYADCDFWDANSYLESNILGVMTELKKYKHGYPFGLCTCKKDEYGGCEIPEGGECDGSKVWDSIVDEIIDGLHASRELVLEETQPPSVHPHLGEPFEFEEVEGSDGKLMRLKPTPDGSPRFVPEEYDKWADPLKKKRKRAMLLLVKHWDSLWD